jgi:phage/plasmid-associated DNA primase
MALEGGTMIAAFNAGNLQAVALALHKMYPDNPIVVCCDNDRFTKAPNGKKWNVGWEKGFAASQEVNGSARIPAFVDSANKQATDFNDLHTLEGIEQVKDQLLNPPTSSTDVAAQPGGAKECLEAQLANVILDTYGDTLIKQDRDLFAFNVETGYWTHYPPKQAQDHFIKQIAALAGGALDFRKLKGAFEHLMVYIPHVPEGHNMFAPSPHVVNFKNGALELERKSDGSYSTNFREKRQSDLLCYSHPFDYTPDAPPNAEFEQALSRVLDDAPAIQAYYELLGACLLPAFPKLVIFVGKPGTGKSTLILFAWHLIDHKLRCAVDPTDWRGFGMETMAGKLVNIDPDIKLTKPIEDSVLKKVEDRIPVRIQRKGITDLYAPLPAVHLFGANRLPMTADGVDAYKRRSIIFRCDKFHVAKTGFVREFANVIWEQNPQGIIAAAIKGLQSLAKNGGHFTPFEASEQELSQWTEEAQNPVRQFLDEFESGQLIVADKSTTVLGDDSGRIDRRALYKCYAAWEQENCPRGASIGSRSFYNMMRDAGKPEQRSNGVRYFAGFGVKEAPQSLA